MTPSLDELRTEALSRAHRAEMNYRLAFFTAAVIEAAFLIAFLMLANFRDRTHLLLFIAGTAVYSIIGFGLLALGAHVTRCTLRVIRAIEGGPA